MSNTPISDSFEEKVSAYGTEREDLTHLEKTLLSKNITLSDWNELVQKYSVTEADSKRLYEALREAIPELEDAINTTRSDLEDADAALLEHVDSATAGALKFGGLKNTYDELPLDSAVGTFYIVIADHAVYGKYSTWVHYAKGTSVTTSYCCISGDVSSYVRKLNNPTNQVLVQNGAAVKGVPLGTAVGDIVQYKAPSVDAISEGTLPVATPIYDGHAANKGYVDLNDVTGFTIEPAKDPDGVIVFGVYNFKVTLGNGNVLEQMLDLPFEAVQLASVNDYIGDDGKRYLEICFADENIAPLNIELDEIFGDLSTLVVDKLDANVLKWNDTNLYRDNGTIKSFWTDTGFSVEDSTGQGVELARAAINLKANRSALFGTPKQEVIIDAGGITVSNREKYTDALVKFPDLPDGTITTLATLDDISETVGGSSAVQSVNGKTGEVVLNASDVGARPSTWTPTYSEVGADKSGTASNLVGIHNTNNESHNDIRLLIEGLSSRLNSLANSDDTTLDQMKEVVAYIKANRGLIEGITTNKINYSDIVDNLVTNASNKPLSAAQGVALKTLIDTIVVNKLDSSALPSAINTALAQAKASGEFDGTSVSVSNVSESAASGGSNVVTFSDGKKVTIKNGINGKDGTDYILTTTDKAEIADLVESATIVQAPKYVESVDDMTDTSRPYVLASTGRIYAYMNETYEKEVTKTDNITATEDNGYLEGQRLGGSGDTFSSDASGYFVTPLIDLTKSQYTGKTIQIHLEGALYSSTGAIATWIQCRLYGNDKAVLDARPYTCDTAVNGSVKLNASGISVTHNSDTSATITITSPTYGSAKTPVGYMRFCAKGAVADSNIYITYPDTETVTGGRWKDTGTTYTPSLTAEEKTEIAEQAAALIDTELLSVIGSGEVSV